MDIYRHLAKVLVNKDVLEVGFGTGLGTLQYADVAKSVFAIEVLEDAYKFASNYLPHQKITWAMGDITNSNGAQFEAVVMVEVLEHIEDWQKALGNVKNILCHRGTLWITARNTNANLRKNDLHEREWSAEELYCNMRSFFSEVELYNYSLDNVLDFTTRQTPLVARCTK
jgi:2-polyprenyl-3-methyl-5-hydroxy-6-metoxy-1,4-benzoquinol methylase